MLDLNKNENDMLEYWEEHKIYEKVKAANKGRKPFYFLDGPPYVSGELHPGQIWVKVRKDLFLRYKRFRGYDLHDRAGYDVHGLPIEHKVEEELKIKNKKEIEERIGIENFIKACKEYTSSLMEKMNRDYTRFGVWMDFKNAYVPDKNEYIESSWNIIKKMSEKGFLYKDKKVVAYCPHCQTSLAQGTQEVEYKDEKDPSIIVAFKVDPKKSRPKADIEISDSTYLLIWTTTPWTLPANVAVAANPNGVYVIASVEGSKYIFAKERFDAVIGAIEKNAVVEGEFFGSELDGIFYTSPLEDKVPEQKSLRKYHKVLMSERLASINEGTGLVHIAPGHGIDDYNLGRSFKLPVFSPVSESAVYTGDAGAYAGIQVPEKANEVVLADLKAAGALLDSGEITHSYPHCWRCGSKLLYLSTDQWFLKIEKIKDKLIKENSKILWHPEEAMKWEESVLMSSPDWCISRQRYWGIPLPIWTCDKCGNTEVMGSMEEIRQRMTNPNEANMIDNLHRPYVDWVVLKCPKCGGEMHRIKDVLDVWFDSGVAWRASLSDEEFERLYPADFILEGSDQFRGWFSTLLKSGVIVHNKSPFKEISVDGMLLAEDGREMHKHLGNYVSPEELLKISSADSIRLWFLKHTHWLDIPMSNAELAEAKRFIMLLYNIQNLIEEYSEAIGYNGRKVKHRISAESLGNEETWLLSKLNSLIGGVTSDMDKYNDSKALSAIIDFITNDFSRFYLRFAKKKILYSDRKEATQAIDVVNHVFYNSLLLLAPFIPFDTESIYLRLYQSKESIFLEKWPVQNNGLIDISIEQEFEIGMQAINALLSSREKAGIKLRWPVSKAVVEVSNESAYGSLQKLAPLIEEFINAKRLEVKLVAGVNRVVKPNFAKLGPAFKSDAPEIAKAISSANPEEIEKGIRESGYYPIHTNRGVFNITGEHFSIIELAPGEDAIAFKYGIAYVSREMSKELMEEALLRELERRIQLVRKELGMKKTEKILLGIVADKEMMQIVEKHKADMLRDLNAKKISGRVDAPNIAKNLDVEGHAVKIEVKKL